MNVPQTRLNARKNPPSGEKSRTRALLAEPVLGMFPKGIYAGGARLLREKETIFSGKIEEGTTAVDSVKQGVTSETTADWLVAV